MNKLIILVTVIVVVYGEGCKDKTYYDDNITVSTESCTAIGRFANLSTEFVESINCSLPSNFEVDVSYMLHKFTHCYMPHIN